ncbi:MAG: hypothetical protein ACRCZF_21330 [Gemmataceae bacterium]
MRRFLMVTSLVLGGTISAAAQSPTPNSGSSVFSMPGQVVGKSSITKVGTAPPQVGQPAGTPIDYLGPGGMPVQTAKPQGQIIDLSNVVAPITAPLAPDLRPNQNRNAIERTYDKILIAIGLAPPPSVVNQSGNWTPGISRRNRERNKFTWWRD